MNINDLVGKSGDEIFRQQTHITRQTNKLHISSTQLIDHLRVVLFARSSASFDYDRLNTTLTSFLKTGCSRFVADHNGDFGIGYLTALHRIDESDHVRASAGDENANLH